MDSSAYGFLGTPIVQARNRAMRLSSRMSRLFTASNFVAALMVLAVILLALGTVIPYTIVNTSMVCRHCGGYQYGSIREYAGIRFMDDQVFVHTLASRLYERLITPAHGHEWILSGECYGRGTLLSEPKLQITKGSGAARSEQIEQGLLALSQSPLAGEIPPAP